MTTFLTSIDIIDTGYLTVTGRTNQLSSSYRVNSGNPMRLKGVEISPTTSSSLDKGATPGFIPATLNSIPQSILKNEAHSLITINPTTISITIILNANNTSTANQYGINDMSLLRHLMKLPHTYGFKAIYYPVDNTATDTGGNTSLRRDSQLVYQIGETDTTESQGDLTGKVNVWTGTTNTSTGKDLTDVNYIPVRFENCAITQVANNIIRVVLTGVITG